MKKQGHKLRLTKEDHVVNMIAGVIATVVLIVTVYPIYYSAIYSISDGQAAQATQIYFLPVSPTLENYENAFTAVPLLGYLLNTLIFSVVTTAATMAGVDAGVFRPLKELSKFLIILAMAAIGLNTDLVKLIRTGGKPILMGLCCWLAIAAVSLGMQHVLGIW